MSVCPQRTPQRLDDGARPTSHLQACAPSKTQFTSGLRVLFHEYITHTQRGTVHAPTAPAHKAIYVARLWAALRWRAERCVGTCSFPRRIVGVVVFLLAGCERLRRWALSRSWRSRGPAIPAPSHAPDWEGDIDHK
nr:potassium voltage-gated channel subfamily E member 2 isoform X2 [Cavia porcellus]